jgi:cytochrome c-type biogenesis protein
VAGVGLAISVRRAIGGAHDRHRNARADRQSGDTRRQSRHTGGYRPALKMGEIGLLVAFVAGIVSFASPCCLPLVPAYVGYMVGATDAGLAVRRREALVESLFFVAGFSAVFITLWASVGLIGYALRDQAYLLRILGGAVLVFMGLHVAGLINISALYREVRLPLGRLAPAGAEFGMERPLGTSHGRSMMLGVTFAAGWTPCVGPILGGIIGLASVSASVVEGTTLLFAYAAGLAIPFVLVAVGATSISHRLNWFRRHSTAVARLTGAMLSVVGFLMITNTFVRLSSFVPFGL